MIYVYNALCAHRHTEILLRIFRCRLFSVPGLIAPRWNTPSRFDACCVNAPYSRPCLPLQLRPGHLPQIKPDTDDAPLAPKDTYGVRGHHRSPRSHASLPLVHGNDDNTPLQPCHSYNFSPQASVKRYKVVFAEDFKLGSSNGSRREEAWNESSETWSPSIDASNSYPSPCPR